MIMNAQSFRSLAPYVICLLLIAAIICLQISNATTVEDLSRLHEESMQNTISTYTKAMAEKDHQVKNVQLKREIGTSELLQSQAAYLKAKQETDSLRVALNEEKNKNAWQQTAIRMALNMRFANNDPHMSDGIKRPKSKPKLYIIDNPYLPKDLDEIQGYKVMVVGEQIFKRTYVRSKSRPMPITIKFTEGDGYSLAGRIMGDISFQRPLPFKKFVSIRIESTDVAYLQGVSVGNRYHMNSRSYVFELEDGKLTHRKEYDYGMIE